MPEPHPPRRRGTRGLLAALVVAALSACSSAAPFTSPPERLEIRRAPPPQPGHSLNATKLCTCTSCEPARCCQGAEEQAATRCDSYDFTSCELSVASCATRCFEHSWRVPTAASCGETRPEVCCEAPGAF